MKITLQISVLIMLAAAGGFAQTTAVSTVALPTYLFMGGSYDQFLGGAFVGTAAIPEVQSAGLFATLTLRMTPVKYTDPKTQKTGYLLGYSATAGQCKQLYPTSGKASNNVVVACADAGASFAATTAPATGTAISFTGSGAPGYIRQIGAHAAVGVFARFSYIANAGPGGAGALDVAPEFGFLWKP